MGMGETVLVVAGHVSKQQSKTNIQYTLVINALHNSKPWAVANPNPGSHLE